MGIDLGSGGARVVICDSRGVVAAEASQGFAPDVDLPPAGPGYHEQDVSQWWPAAQAAIRAALAQASSAGVSPQAVRALAVTSTSGTLVPLGADHRPLGPALMYNDSRAVAQAEQLNALAADFNARLGRSFQPSFALCKILWVAQHDPARFAQAALWAHAGDYLVGCLTGVFNVSDYSSALKTGYDLLEQRWPAFIAQAGIPLERLPRVVAPGAVIGSVSVRAAEATGLALGTVVRAGMTDASAALLASGAARPGEWNSTLGTTLALKGISEALVRDPLGRVYCHLHPLGWWLPGAASSVGGERLRALAAGQSMALLDQQAAARGPSRLVMYPLARRGERFPFVAPDAEGFVIGQLENDIDLYRACLEGVALVERLCYDVLAELGAPAGERLYVTGGGSRSAVWNQIRADALGRQLARPEQPESVFGAALLAAAGTLYDDVAQAAGAMVRIASVVDPDPAARAHYDDQYARLLKACRARGYL
ncbi:MAG: FGGY-family carbohydrate kinase [Aggregatilineales bacterium]